MYKNICKTVKIKHKTFSANKWADDQSEEMPLKKQTTMTNKYLKMFNIFRYQENVN